MFFLNRLLLIALLLTPFKMSSAEISEEKFQELLSMLQPSDDEIWRSIPWTTSVLDAQRISCDEQKPIFIWAMDGHPLGCT